MLVNVNAEKTKCMLLPLDQNPGQNYEIKLSNKSFENKTEFKYLETIVSNQNIIEE
jgi:hypothetical protein